MAMPRKDGPRWPSGGRILPSAYAYQTDSIKRERKNKRERVARAKYLSNPDNKARYNARKLKNATKNRAIRRAFVLEYKSAHPCVDCGESDPVVLDFDHKDHSLKKYNVGQLIQGDWSLELLKEEIEKCEIRCANCHRRKTHYERHLYKKRQKQPVMDLPLFGELTQ